MTVSGQKNLRNSFLPMCQNSICRPADGPSRSSGRTPAGATLANVTGRCPRMAIFAETALMTVADALKPSRWKTYTYNSQLWKVSRMYGFPMALEPRFFAVGADPADAASKVPGHSAPSRPCFPSCPHRVPSIQLAATTVLGPYYIERISTELRPLSCRRSADPQINPARVWNPR